jgi:hypothetical protein
VAQVAVCSQINSQHINNSAGRTYHLQLLNVKLIGSSCNQQPLKGELAAVFDFVDSYWVPVFILNLRMSVELNGCLKVEVNSGVGLLYLHLPCLLKMWDVNCTLPKGGKIQQSGGGGGGGSAGLKNFLLWRSMMVNTIIPPRNIGLPQESSISLHSWHRFWNPILVRFFMPIVVIERATRFILVSVSLILWFRAHTGLAYDARVRCWIYQL